MALSLRLRYFAFLAVGSAVGFGSADHTAAQLGSQNDALPSPTVSLTDEVGVDMTSGRRTDIHATLTIGDRANPSLSHSAAYQPYGTEMGGEIRIICVPGQYSACQSSYMVFSLGTKVEYASGSSTLTDGSFFSYSVSTQAYSVHDKSGREWLFVKFPYVGNGKPTHYLSEIREADGRRLIYNYHPFTSSIISTMRSVASIVSSDGFQLNLTSNGPWPPSAALTNRRHISCSELSDCTGTDFSWPKIVYGPVISGNMHVSVSGGRDFDYSDGLYYSSGEFVRYSTQQAVCSSFVAGYVGISGSQGQTPQYCIRTTRVETPRGSWNYAYNGIRITATDPSGGTYTSDISESEVVLTDKLLRQSRYKYTGSTFRAGDFTRYVNTNVSEITYPEGNKDIYTYGPRANLTNVVRQAKLGSPVAAQNWSAAYPTSCTIANFRVCNKPIYVADPKGGRTDFTYDEAHGGVLTETMAADSAGVRGIRRFGYQQLSATYLNANGQMSAGQPIWKLAWIKECMTSAACQGTSQEVVTTFDYNENLLTRGMSVTADGQTLRTCYGYDKIGNRISETKPKAGLSSCS